MLSPDIGYGSRKGGSTRTVCPLGSDQKAAACIELWVLGQGGKDESRVSDPIRLDFPGSRFEVQSEMFRDGTVSIELLKLSWFPGKTGKISPRNADYRL